MRTTPLIAATLFAASAAGAQVTGNNCRGQTLSALANCVAERAAPPVAAPVVEGTAPLNARTVSPTALGGALSPQNLRTEPPLVGRPVVAPANAGVLPLPGNITAFDALGGVTRDPTSPLYGLGQTGLSRQRILQYDPLVGSGIGIPNR